jgi:hypothetical protein
VFGFQLRVVDRIAISDQAIGEGQRSCLVIRPRAYPDKAVAELQIAAFGVASWKAADRSHERLKQRRQRAPTRC